MNPPHALTRDTTRTAPDRSVLLTLLLVLMTLVPLRLVGQTNWALIGWNNLGMHCMDSDFSIFSILPPYNTVHAQLIDNQGRLVTNTAGLGVTYRAIADPEGSFNATSIGKGNFWEHAEDLFGIALPPDTGLPVPGPQSFHMPGTSNVPQAMAFETGMKWFAAYGIPITPYDDTGKPNQYPMLRLVATNSAGQVLAMTDVVVPVSDEMDCRLCHESGSGAAAEPAAGWVWQKDPGRDYRLNILRLHDQYQAGDPLYTNALAHHGFNLEGLEATVARDGRPILCAACHLSEALPGSGLPGIPPLTTAMHGRHATVLDPRNGQTLDASDNRLSCYSCHPGSETRCLRGAMGKAIAPDGTMLMQCQSCHGTMSTVGDPGRTGWLEEPNCQACHVGNAINPYGVIRFDDAFSNGVLRTPADLTFATAPDTPAPGISLYRFSTGHGGLQCAACHGSTHAEFPSALFSDNMATTERQGHAGVLSECTACHQTMPNTRNGGPHGMHRTGQAWIGDHNNAAQALGLNACRACHGATGQGSVLGLAFSEKTVTSERGTVHYWRGRKVTCYGCHDGMNTGDPTTHGVPPITNVTGSTTSGIPVAISLSGPNTRIVTQPHHGAVALAGSLATYFPEPYYAGTDSFTFAVNNGYNDSELGTATVTVSADPAHPQPHPAAEFFAFAQGGPGRIDAAFASELGQAYRTQRSSDLRGDTWADSGDTVWGVTDATRISLTDAVASVAAFRVVATDTPPQPVAASDSATNAIYDAGWNSGMDGGEGFGPWILSVSNGANAGFFIGTAAVHASMDVPVRGWGLWANSGSSAGAVRRFDRALAVGDALTVRFDNNFIQSGGQAGIGLMNSNAQVLVEFLFVGGESTYRVNDQAGSRITYIPWSNRGWDVTLRIAADGHYHLLCGPYAVAGILKSVPDRNAALFKVWNANAGTGGDHDVYLGDLRIIQP